MDARKTQENSDIIVIKDPNGILWTLAGVAFFGALTLWSLFEFAVGGIIVSGALTYLFFMVFKSKNEGVVLDIKNDILAYPGGKAADDITDYINLDWWKQNIGMKRQEIKLSEINAIDAASTRVYEPKSKTYHYSHTISLTGSFGSITIPFGGESKRDQLYNALREKLNMGNPVIITN